ncbi:hypothetical protein F8388_006866, partial [Cannabis sativa]
IESSGLQGYLDAHNASEKRCYCLRVRCYADFLIGKVEAQENFHMPEKVMAMTLEFAIQLSAVLFFLKKDHLLPLVQEKDAIMGSIFSDIIINFEMIMMVGLLASGLSRRSALQVPSPSAPPDVVGSIVSDNDINSAVHVHRMNQALRPQHGTFVM